MQRAPGLVFSPIAYDKRVQWSPGRIAAAREQAREALRRSKRKTRRYLPNGRPAPVSQEHGQQGGGSGDDINDNRRACGFDLIESPWTYRYLQQAKDDEPSAYFSDGDGTLHWTSGMIRLRERLRREVGEVEDIEKVSRGEVPLDVYRQQQNQKTAAEDESEQPPPLSIVALLNAQKEARSKDIMKLVQQSTQRAYFAKGGGRAGRLAMNRQPKAREVLKFDEEKAAAASREGKIKVGRKKRHGPVLSVDDSFERRLSSARLSATAGFV